MSVQLSFHCTVATLALIVADLQTAEPHQAEPHHIAQAHCTEGLLYLHLEQWPQAMACYKKAIAEFRTAHDFVGLGQTCCHLGTLLLQRHHYGPAQRWAEIAVYSLTKANCTTHSSEHMQAHYAAALHLLGQANRYQGHYALAIKQLEQVLAIRHRLQDEIGEAMALVDLGQVYQAQ